jgi:hypothetical protein
VISGFNLLSVLDCGLGNPISYFVSAIEHFGVQDVYNFCNSPWSEYLPYEFDGVVISDVTEARQWLVVLSLFVFNCLLTLKR